MFSFKICKKAIKQEAFSLTQVFITVLHSILDFQAIKDTETLSWLCVHIISLKVNINYLLMCLKISGSIMKSLDENSC